MQASTGARPPRPHKAPSAGCVRTLSRSAVLSWTRPRRAGRAVTVAPARSGLSQSRPPVSRVPQPGKWGRSCPGADRRLPAAPNRARARRAYTSTQRLADALTPRPYARQPSAASASATGKVRVRERTKPTGGGWERDACPASMSSSKPSGASWPSWNEPAVKFADIVEKHLTGRLARGSGAQGVGGGGPRAADAARGAAPLKCRCGSSCSR
jgi:hypothetical protein